MSYAYHFCRCIHSKKHKSIKGYAKCEIKGCTMTDHCYLEEAKNCKFYKPHLLNGIFGRI